MKKAAKILCIIALIIGLIWATVGFFGVWFGGAVVGAVQEMSQDSVSADATMETSVSIMLRLLGSFVVVIIGGVLGIVGASKEPSKLKPIILGILTFVCGFALFPLSNYVAAALYLVAGLLLLLAGLTTKIENESADRKRKDLILALISIGIVLLVVVGGYFILRDNSEKQAKTTIENTSEEYEQQVSEMSFDEQLEQIRENFKRINSIKNWSSIDEKELSESSEGGEGKFYYQNEQLEKIVAHHFGEMGQVIIEYYLHNGQLSFVFEKTEEYNRPIYYDLDMMEEFGDTEAFDPKKSKIIEKRSYFENGRLIHRIESKNKEFSEVYLLEEEKRIKTDFEGLIKLAKNK
jgi:flagellar basal body-associated protein FliL